MYMDTYLSKIAIWRQIQNTSTILQIQCLSSDSLNDHTASKIMTLKY